jgi:hypothetical protein
MHITLEAVQAKQAELERMIQQLTAPIKARQQIEVEACTIELQPGEHYAGAVLDEHGRHMHHVILMAARPNNKMGWEDARQWAEDVGGDLPTRQELALLYANCKPHLPEVWAWSGEEHKDDASFAWGCDFDDGIQSLSHKSFQGSAVAVRRV